MIHRFYFFFHFMPYTLNSSSNSEYSSVMIICIVQIPWIYIIQKIISWSRIRIDYIFFTDMFFYYIVCWSLFSTISNLISSMFKLMSPTTHTCIPSQWAKSDSSMDICCYAFVLANLSRLDLFLKSEAIAFLKLVRSANIILMLILFIL